MAPLLRDEMSALLDLLSDEVDFETWLCGSQPEAFALAKSFDPAAMRIVQSGFEKQDLLAE